MGNFPETSIEAFLSDARHSEICFSAFYKIEFLNLSVILTFTCSSVKRTKVSLLLLHLIFLLPVPCPALRLFVFQRRHAVQYSKCSLFNVLRLCMTFSKYQLDESNAKLS